ACLDAIALGRVEMTYLVVPHGVSANSATVWLGGINESLDQVELTLVPHGNYQTLDSVRQQWEAQNGMYKLDYRRDTLGQLEPRKPYTAELRVNREYKASAQFTTLPAQLPTVDEKPFTAML